MMMARMVIQNDFLSGICMIRGSEHTACRQELELATDRFSAGEIRLDSDARMFGYSDIRIARYEDSVIDQS